MDLEEMPEAYWVIVKDFIVKKRKKYLGDSKSQKG